MEGTSPVYLDDPETHVYFRNDAPALPLTIDPTPDLARFPSPPTSLPQDSLYPHPQSQKWIEGVHLESLLPTSTFSCPPPEAVTTSLRRESIDEPELQVTSLPPR